MKTAVIVLSHGSRSGGADLILKQVAGEIKKHGSFAIVEHAFLQYGQPDADTALEQCIRQGAKKIVIVPFFMQPGAHVTRDIPALVQRSKERHPGVKITVSDFVGAHPRISEIILDLVVKADQ